MFGKIKSAMRAYAHWWLYGSFEPDRQEVLEHLGDLMNEMAALSGKYVITADEIIRQAEKERRLFHKGIH